MRGYKPEGRTVVRRPWGRRWELACEVRTGIFAKEEHGDTMVKQMTGNIVVDHVFIKFVNRNPCTMFIPGLLPIII